MKIHIKDLLSKYIANNTTQYERSELSALTANLSDAELGDILSDIWQDYSHKIRPSDFDELIERLQIKPEKKALTVIKLITRIAAAILLPIFLISQVYLYTDNKKTHAFLNQAITVNVKSGDVANITLPDGTQVFLNSATTLSYPANFGFEKRNMQLNGEAYLKVSKNPELPFIVDTEYLKIEVLGTEFNVTSYDYLEVVETTLIAGSVQLTTKGNNSQFLVLSPGEKATYDKESGQLTVNETTTHFETAWLQGDLVFRSANFTQIINKLKLRYGVDIEINGGKYDADLFTGSFKESSVYNVLKNLQIHYNFTYTTGTDDRIQIQFK
ncbi:iron dicitrate transporter FecR [Bacteroidia bacterium]|nr:iron dicitrate transporter FecR [Bacteroidia bacterium]